MPQQNEEIAGSNLSRREFMKGSAVSVAGLAVAGTASDPAQAVQPSATAGPGPVAVTLNINGRDQTLKVEPRVTLLDALRNHLDLTGAKKVCDRATCGACTVLADGQPIYACTALAIDVQGRKITTIEGLGDPQHLSHVQAAFVENDAQQCGFCTPGFVVACTSFLQQNPNPSLEDVKNGLGGNFCRCGTYRGVTRAVLDAAKAMRGGA